MYGAQCIDTSPFQRKQWSLRKSTLEPVELATTQTAEHAARFSWPHRELMLPLVRARSACHSPRLHPCMRVPAWRSPLHRPRHRLMSFSDHRVRADYPPDSLRRLTNMSELDDIKSEVEKTGTEITNAKTAAELTNTTTEEKIDEMNMLGLEGVVMTLQAVARDVQSAIGQLGDAHSQADEATTGLSGVTDKTRVSETVAALDKALQSLGNSGTLLQQANGNTENALTQAQHAEVEAVTTHVMTVMQAVGQAQTVAQATVTKAQAYRNKIEGSSKGLTSSTSRSPSPPPFQTEVVATPRGQPPTQDHEPVAKIGDPIQPPQGGPDDTSDHRAELKSADDEDSARSKASRFGRAFARNASDVAATSKDATDSASFSIDDGYDPHDYGNSTATTQADVRVPVISSYATDVKASDVVGTTVVLTVIAVEGVTRLIRKKGNAK